MARSGRITCFLFYVTFEYRTNYCKKSYISKPQHGNDFTTFRIGAVFMCYETLFMHIENRCNSSAVVCD